MFVININTINNRSLCTFCMNNFKVTFNFFFFFFFPNQLKIVFRKIEIFVRPWVGDFVKKLYPENACTLVPTVFLRHLKTKFEFPFSFSVYLRFRKTEFKLLFLFSVFLRRRKTEFEIVLSYFVFLNHWKIELRTSIFAFRFPTT